jgi:hypothetical protein
MSKTATASANGKARKSLSDQLDRLDGIIDALSEGLNEAVQTAVAEALQDPQTLATLRAALTPPRPPSTPLRRVKEGLGRAWSWLSRQVGRACSAVAGLLVRGAELVSGVSSPVLAKVRPLGLLLGVLACLLWYQRRRVVMAVGMGIVVGWACYRSGPLVAALVGGTAVACLTPLAFTLVPVLGFALMHGRTDPETSGG